MQKNTDSNEALLRQNSDKLHDLETATGQQKWRQTRQRWVQIATATEKSYCTACKLDPGEVNSHMKGLSMISFGGVSCRF